jgi:hypothetical protein
MVGAKVTLYLVMRIKRFDEMEFTGNSPIRVEMITPNEPRYYCEVYETIEAAKEAAGEEAEILPVRKNDE